MSVDGDSLQLGRDLMKSVPSRFPAVIAAKLQGICDILFGDSWAYIVQFVDSVWARGRGRVCAAMIEGH